jgi:DNA-binding MarR family transcriptional regulator
LSHNDLRKWLDPKTFKKRKGRLLANGLIKKRLEKSRGGTKHIYFLTPKGKEELQRIVSLDEIGRNYRKMFKPCTEDEKLDALSNLLTILFESFLLKSDFEKSFPRLLDAIELPFKDTINRWGLFHKNRFERYYYDPQLHVEQMPARFIIEDARLAFQLSHFLNRHHIYVLTRLDHKRETELAERNAAWLSNHKHEDMEKESNVRIEHFSHRFPHLIHKPEYEEMFSKKKA